MKDLNFSDPITLAYNQRGSIVIDDIIPKDEDDPNYVPQLANYGLIKIEDKNFDLKCRKVHLNSSRNLSAIGSDQEAVDVLTTVCASRKEKKVNYTVKSFPHYGAYGFVNYDEGDSSSYQSGDTLDKSRSGGGVFT